VDVESGSGSNHSLRTLASHSFEIPADRLKSIDFFDLYRELVNTTPESIIKNIYSCYNSLFCRAKLLFVTNLLKIIKIIKKLLDLLHETA